MEWVGVGGWGGGLAAPGLQPLACTSALPRLRLPVAALPPSLPMQPGHGRQVLFRRCGPRHPDPAGG